MGFYHTRARDRPSLTLCVLAANMWRAVSHGEPASTHLCLTLAWLAAGLWRELPLDERARFQRQSEVERKRYQKHKQVGRVAVWVAGWGLRKRCQQQELVG